MSNPNIHLFTLSGSRLYGLDTPESDYDYRGVFSAPLSHYVGGIDRPQIEGITAAKSIPHEPHSKDTVVYDLKKFIGLAAKSNPNIIELLWVNEYLYLDAIGEKLIALRDVFLTDSIRHTFAGYAHSQLKRLESHRKWLLDPPDLSKPLNRPENLLDKVEVNAFLEFLYTSVKDVIEFSGPAEELAKILSDGIDYKAVFKNYALDEAGFRKLVSTDSGPPNYLRALQETHEYRRNAAHRAAYEKWLETRNPTRAAAERKCGYDSKNALHLMRLLLQAEHIIKDDLSQRLVVSIDDLPPAERDLMVRIRDGEVPYSELMAVAELKFKLVKNARTSLPKAVSEEYQSDLLWDLLNS